MKLKLNKGDRVCFFGDSITADGRWIKEIFEHFKREHNALEIGFYNCGIGGSKGYEANLKNRMYADLFRFFPKYVVVMFGMNDIYPWMYDPENKQEDKVEVREKQLKDYPSSLENIIELCKKYGAEPIICSPTVYDEYNEREKENWYANSALKKCGEYAKETAEKYGLLFVDMHTPLLEKIDEMPISEDRIHPNEYGYHIMAQTFLKAIGEIQEIDADKKCNFSEVNNRRYETEQKIRSLMFTERDVMGWQNEENKTIEERKRLIKERAEKEDWLLPVAENYCKYADYRDDLYGELIELSLKMYE